MTSTDERHDVEELEGVVLVTRRERELAVSHWLLAAALDHDVAREEWRTLGVALLACGGIFAAIRMPGELVRAAAGAQGEEGVDAFLRRALEAGPSFRDRHSDAYYALVPGSTAWSWSPSETFRGLQCLGRDCYLGVPAVDRTEPEGREYWCAPMASPGELCDPRLVWAMVQLGQMRHRAAEAGGGGR
ncbi:hypothetical protein ACIQMV_38500 [Streptomyces sp. NPDC091412]|uniref:hypothetical protein n=1 Tax=Streptomyces sp. NPDC091412 TaxID=3366002 RepID=UPI0038034DD6